MKWEQYKVMTEEHKQEYNFRFGDEWRFLIVGLIGCVSMSLSRLRGRDDLFIISALIALFGIGIFWLGRYSQSRWAKERGYK